MVTEALDFPRSYNAAHDLLTRNIIAGRADEIACIDDFGAHTYAQLHARANQVGHLLSNLGVAIEQRVLLLLHDTADFIACFLGAMQIGAVPVPVNTLLTPADYLHLLTDSRARVLLVSDALLPRAEQAIAGARNTPTSSSSAHRSAATTARTHISTPSCTTSHRAHPRRHHPRRRRLLAVLLRLDRPQQGAVHLHAHLARTAVLYAHNVLGLRQTDTVYSAAKLFFAYGLGNALTFPLYTGARTILRADRPTPALVLATLREHAVTVFGGVPTLFASLLASPELRPRASPCASPIQPVKPCRATSASNGGPASAATSSTASAPPSCCTSSCPTPRRPPLRHQRPTGPRLRAAPAGRRRRPGARR